MDSPATFPAPSLPPISDITAFSTTYAWPELLKWALFAASIGIVVMVIKRLGAK